MTHYQLEIDSSNRWYTKIKYENSASHKTIPTWEARLAYANESVSADDVVNIKRKEDDEASYTTVFTGIVEYEKPIVDENGVKRKLVGGRHLAVYLWRKWAERMEDEEGYWTDYYPHKVIAFLTRRIRSEKPSLVEDYTTTRIGWGMRPDKEGEQWDISTTTTGSGAGENLIAHTNTIGWTSNDTNQAAEYFTIDLGTTVQNIVGIRVENRYNNNYPRSYQIRLSPNGSDWTNIATQTLNKARNVVESWDWSDLPTSPVNYQSGIRYIRFICTAATTNIPLSVFRVFLYQATDGAISGISLGTLNTYLPFNCSEITSNELSTATSVTVRHGWKFQVGDTMIIADENGDEVEKKITSISTNTLSFATQIGFAIDTGNNPWAANMEQNHSVKVNIPYKRRTDAIDTIAKLCIAADNTPWDWWVTNAGALNFQAQRGSDLSGSVSFVSGTNIYGTEHSQDYRNQVDVINVLGKSDSKDVVAQDRNSSGWVGSGEYEYVVVDKEVGSEEGAKAKAYQLLDEYDDLTDSIVMTVDNNYATGTWDVGDTVTITDSLTGISGTYRIEKYQVVYDDNGEKTTIYAKSKLFSVIEYLRNAENDVRSEKMHQLYTNEVYRARAESVKGYPEFIYFYEAEHLSHDYEGGAGTLTVVNSDIADNGAYLRRTSGSNAGIMVHGPGLALKAGRYRAVFKIACGTTTGSSTIAQLQVHSETYGGQLATMDVTPEDFSFPDSFQSFIITFSSNVDYDDYEFRVDFTDGISEFWIDWIGIVYAGTGTVEDIDLDYPAGAPATPTGLSSDVRPNAVLLTWNANTEQDLSHYSVYKNTVDTFGTATKVADLMNTYYVYTASNSEYEDTLYFWVTASDIVGNESSETSSVNETVPKVEPADLQIEMLPWTSDINFIWDEANQDWDKIWWGQANNETDTPATIEFADGTSTGVNFGTEAALADGVYYYYWDETQKTSGNYDLKSTTDYATAVGEGKGLVAIVQINEASAEAPDLLTFNSYVPTIGGGMIAAYAVQAKHITADWITGKKFRTAGRVSSLAGVEFDDNGIVMYDDSNNKTLELDASDGSVKLYGYDGAFEIYENDGSTKLGELRGSSSKIQLIATETDKDVQIAAGASYVTVEGEAAGNILLVAGTGGEIRVSNDVVPNGGAATVGQSTDKFTSMYAVDFYGTSHLSDLFLNDLICPACGKPFKMGDTLIMVVKGFNDDPEQGKEIRLIPMHLDCEILESMKDKMKDLMDE